jgi:hypothetical protein
LAGSLLREWRKLGCPIRSSLKNWKGRNEEEDPGKMGRRSGKRSSGAGSEKMKRVGDRDKWRGIVRQDKAHSGL